MFWFTILPTLPYMYYGYIYPIEIVRMSIIRKRSIITHQGQKKKHLGQEVQKIR